jgi:hypothetical protein
MENVFPAIITVPVRDADVVLALTLYITVPLPDPLAPPVTESHVAVEVAAHEQPAPAVTVTVPVAATGDVRFTEIGEIATEHGAPACVTVNV